MTKSSRRTILKALSATMLAGRDLPGQARGRYLIGPTKTIRNTAPNQVVALPPGPQLFVDDYLVLRQEGLARITHHPRRLPHPIVTSKEFGVFQPYVTVIRDVESGMFRMWYNAWSERTGIAKGNYLAYADSKDGLEWHAPELSLIGKSNLLMPIHKGYGASVLAARGRSPKKTLTDVRGSVDSARYRAATVRERFLPRAARRRTGIQGKMTAL